MNLQFENNKRKQEAGIEQIPQYVLDSLNSNITFSLSFDNQTGNNYYPEVGANGGYFYGSNNPLNVSGKLGFCLPVRDLYDRHANPTSQITNSGNIQLTNIATDNQELSFSISVWLKQNDSDGLQGIIDCYNGSGFRIWSNGITLLSTFYASNGVVRYVNLGSFFNDTEWKHLVFTYNGNIDTPEFHIYKNGVDNIILPNDTNGTYEGMNFNSSVRMIGSVTNNTSRVFMGDIDDFHIYKNYVLSQEEVTALYNGGNGLIYPFAN